MQCLRVGRRCRRPARATASRRAARRSRAPRRASGSASSRGPARRATRRARAASTASQNGIAISRNSPAARLEAGARPRPARRAAASRARKRDTCALEERRHCPGGSPSTTREQLLDLLESSELERRLDRRRRSASFTCSARAPSVRARRARLGRGERLAASPVGAQQQRLAQPRRQRAPARLRESSSSASSSSDRAAPRSSWPRWTWIATSGRAEHADADAARRSSAELGDELERLVPVARARRADSSWPRSAAPTGGFRRRGRARARRGRVGRLLVAVAPASRTSARL